VSVGTGVTLGVFVAIAVLVAVFVGTSVPVGTGVLVEVPVGTTVLEGVSDGVPVGVSLTTGVRVLAGVGVSVAVCVLVGVTVRVDVCALVRVAVGVDVGVGISWPGISAPHKPKFPFSKLKSTMSITWSVLKSGLSSQFGDVGVLPKATFNRLKSKISTQLSPLASPAARVPISTSVVPSWRMALPEVDSICGFLTYHWYAPDSGKVTVKYPLKSVVAVFSTVVPLLTRSIIAVTGTLHRTLGG
jgi:hypothetical protein